MGNPQFMGSERAGNTDAGCLTGRSFSDVGSLIKEATVATTSREDD